MILIADSGATKTDWCYGTGGSERVRIQTEGINPVHQSETYIRHIIEEQLFPSCEEAARTCTSIYFYGAGCLPSVSSSIREALQCFFPKAHMPCAKTVRALPASWAQALIRACTTVGKSWNMFPRSDISWETKEAVLISANVSWRIA